MKRLVFDLVVTRHPALVAYLREQGLIDSSTPVLAHASPEDVRDKAVLGVLPLALASAANVVGEIPLSLAPEMRGRELSLSEVRAVAGPLRVYRVQAQAEAEREAEAGAPA